MDSVLQRPLRHPGHLGDSAVRDEVLPRHGRFPGHMRRQNAGHLLADWVRPNDAAFPRRGRATSSTPYSACTEPGLVWNIRSARGSQPQHYQHPGLENSSLRGGCLVPFGRFRSIPSLNPLDASKPFPPSPNCENPNCLQAVPNVPWGEHFPLLRTTGLGPSVWRPRLALLSGGQV